MLNVNNKILLQMMIEKTEKSFSDLSLWWFDGSRCNFCLAVNLTQGPMYFSAWTLI